MLPRDKFNIPSSKSPTVSSEGGSRRVPQTEYTLVQFVKGVGPKLSAIFNHRNIKTVQDLLFFFPRAYEDRSKRATISSLTEGITATLAVQVLSQRQIPVAKWGRSILEIRCADSTGEMSLKWFRFPRGTNSPHSMEKKWVRGTPLIVTGKVKFFMGRPEMVHPEVTTGAKAQDFETDEDLNFGRVVPIYTELEGISSRRLRAVIWEALEKHSSFLVDDIPGTLLEQRRLPSLRKAVRWVHFPPDRDVNEGTVNHDEKGNDIKGNDISELSSFNTPAHHRLIYDDFFKFEYLMLRRRLQSTRVKALHIEADRARQRIDILKKLLPFTLTQGQNQALEDIVLDFSRSYPMNRLVQGDVGSGKTAVAFLSAACVLNEGGQCALMAPTEILAEQHYKNAIHLFKNIQPEGPGILAGNVVLLTGKTSVSERTAIAQSLKGGIPLLLVGTHALLEDWVSFSKLDYVMIDEQHRFGVDQRGRFKQKGIRKDLTTGEMLYPHSLVLTATPIPRTLALSVFGDLAVTSIREVPPGRSPVHTKVIRDEEQRRRVYEGIRKELQSGRQAYFIYPLVEDSDADGFTQLKSAVAEAENLAQEVFPEFSVGLLHGQLGAADKANVMERFKQNTIQILVSTTVVEVGVDVPNATVMVIEHADRFGLSQLHQLRGRVGRGKFQSYCYLLTRQRDSNELAGRLDILEHTQDGFQIAEADLKIRGPGEFLGVRQAGELPFRMANLIRDQHWLIQARNDVIDLIRRDPDLVLAEHQCLKRYFEREGWEQLDWLGAM